LRATAVSGPSTTWTAAGVGPRRRAVPVVAVLVAAVFAGPLVIIVTAPLEPLGPSGPDRTAPDPTAASAVDGSADGPLGGVDEVTGEADVGTVDQVGPTTDRRVAVGLLLVLATVGVNFVAWGMVGAVRYLDERQRPRDGRGPPGAVRPADVAVLIAAHNEEAVILDALRSVRGIVPRGNVYVASDGSTDATSELVRSVGVHVLDVRPNRGKAGALRAALEHFRMLDRYEAVLFVDADTRLDPGYLRAALPWFDDAEVVAVAGYAKPIWEPGARSLAARLIAAHRHRLYAITQMLQKYGQTWRLSNVAYIVPGFASVYRTDALRRMEMDPPGLVIEDFNMTFEIHHRGLGRIAFTPDALAFCHEPGTLRDYAKQVRRWVLGFWQTVRRHGIWPGGFWAALGFWIAEIVVASLVFVSLPFVVVVLLLPEVVAGAATWPGVGAVHGVLANWVTLPLLLGAVLLPDLVVTTALAIRDRRPLYPLLALAFPFLRVTDAAIGLLTIPKSWTETSTGAWTSPSRT
jgi:poly-beta-1,6-N-acetyl-D-glucosamine synthase